jgi:protein SCO1/2
MSRRLAALLLLAGAAGPAAAQPGGSSSPEQTYTYEQRLNGPVPPDLPFRDEEGRDVTLGDFCRERPVVLALVQYRCKMLCNQVLNGLADALRGVPVNAGEGYEVVVVSFDARETPELAAAKKAGYVEDYGRPGAERGWHFLTGEQESIDVLTASVGFHYAYSKPLDRFAHPSGIVVLTPAVAGDGGAKAPHVSRYFYGIAYDSDELAAAIKDAAAAKIGRAVPTYGQVLLLCYDYDPSTGNYVFNVMRVLRLAGLLTIGLLAVFLGPTWKKWWLDALALVPEDWPGTERWTTTAVAVELLMDWRKRAMWLKMVFGLTLAVILSVAYWTFLTVIDLMR